MNENNITSSIYPIALITYLFGIFFFLAIAIFALIDFIIKPVNNSLGGVGIVVGLLLIGVSILEIVMLSRVPYKISLHDNQLSISGIRGKKTIKLNEIVTVKTAAYFASIGSA